MSMFTIGLSGLNAAQNALNTTSNNISNVYTPGYNREITILNESNNSGVRVEDIQRQFNTFVAAQLNNAKSQSSALNVYSNQVTQIDNLLADRAAGLAPLMQEFFSSLEDLASAPSDPASRQGVLGSANTLSAQFRSFDGYLQDLQSGVNGQIKDEITQINNTTAQIGSINREISLARAQLGEAPNSLLNQRDHLISQLNERMDIRLNIQDGKTYNLTLPNGQPLVTGDTAYKLEAIESPNDPQRVIVGYKEGARGNGNLIALDEGLIRGGALGGLMSFRSETLDKTQNQIGQLSASLAVAFNNQHQQGVDLNGDQGKAFFNLGQSNGYFNANNDGNASVKVAIDPDNIDALRATDYSIKVTDAVSTPPTFEVIRKDNGSEVETSFDAASNTLSFGGVNVEFVDLNTAQTGDQFEVQPVRRVAGGMDSAIVDLDKIAAARLIEREGDLDISKLTAASGAFASSDEYKLDVDGAGNLTVLPATTVTVTRGDTVLATGTALEAGDKISIDGLGFTLDALPSTGSASLTVSRSDASAGDNRNALALQNLQSQDVVGGRASVSGAYAAIVSDVGNRTNIVQVNLDARQGLTDQLNAVQQSESGVNLDEEAANLIRFQQYYQANARVIDTASTIFDTILGLRS
ncbi:flagellar hook-associated protein FlgK [Halomonas sp. FeN2]|uniref:Flagellar hook-associated protein 1 n=1 Tax=Vreelandella neptunia TaxID=115551 RepID=A0ABZ0YNV9_9GAMM|nr:MULTISPECIES: flagellar hook-associated protein FlgK [Halomonas]TDV89864.1 flagellar hook-associated protein 1 FlgK [Halomonas alkaliantarctica]MBF59007.1 flagellar hook-associated protein FlgK [Halomonas sp.]MDN3562430.1 flagellar hook-associated protein FlgK [Halomonas neptunia]UBR48101.1 flagellar hook-associated protein FlgK [Halomonas sp. FeN2]WQH12967.1 flagellar hook-associated protein FlgK [Halomonas neptunia]